MGVAAIAATVLLTSCTSNTRPTESGRQQQTGNQRRRFSAPGKQVTVMFSGPVADHGFLAAINSFAKQQAAQYRTSRSRCSKPRRRAVPDRRRADRHRAEAGRADHLPAGRRPADRRGEGGRTEAGIPVINLDRKFNDQAAYRMFLAGDNYKVGFNAGKYIGRKLKRQQPPPSSVRSPGSRRWR